MPTLRIGANGAVVDQDPGSTFIATSIDNDGEIRAEADGLTLPNGSQGTSSNGDYRAEADDTLGVEGNTTLRQRRRPRGPGHHRARQRHHEPRRRRG